MGSHERRERERGEMRELILSAAMKLFLDESFEKTTMRRIAEAIEYTPGALYGYFKDKSEILFALHERGFDELVAGQQAVLAASTDPVERLRGLGRSYIQFALENPAQYRLMFMDASTGKRIVENAEWRPGTQAFDTVRDVMREFVAVRELPIDPDVAAFGCWATVHGLASLVIADRCVMYAPDELKRTVEGALELYLVTMTAGCCSPTCASNVAPVAPYGLGRK